jgi:sulfite oxidase
MRAWAWTLWSYQLPFDQLPKEPFEIVCRAMDTHVQPDSARGIWNVRGVMNNAWHKMTVQIDRKDSIKTQK